MGDQVVNPQGVTFREVEVKDRKYKVLLITRFDLVGI